MTSSDSGSLCIMAPTPGTRRALTGVGDDVAGGKQVQWVLLTRCLRDTGWSVTVVVAADGEPPAEAEVDGLRVLCLRPGGLGTRVIDAWKALSAAGSELYVTQGAAPWVALTAAFAKARRRKFLFWAASDTDLQCREPAHSRVRRAWRYPCWWGIRQADALITQTHTQAELARRYVGRDAVVVPNVWPVARSATPVRDGPVLWVSNIRWEKRPLMVAEVAAAVPEARFVMVGGRVPGQEALYDHVARVAATTPNLDFVGPVPLAEVDEYYASACLLLNTSQVEGFPNTYLQAWANACPVVGTFDPDEVICRHGLGVHATDAGELAAAIERLMAAPSDRLAMGSACLTHIQHEHSVERVLEAFGEAVAIARRSGPTEGTRGRQDKGRGTAAIARGEAGRASDAIRGRG